MAGNRTDDRTDTPRIESHTVARAGHLAPQSGQRDAHRAAARPRAEERDQRTERDAQRSRPSRPVQQQGREQKRSGGSLQEVLQGHRQQMRLAALSDRTAGRATAEAGPPSRKATPPREEYKRNPKDPRSPLRPSITTLSQTQSYGPQNFGRDDVIDKPRKKPQPGGGADLPMPAMAPPRAAGTDTSQSRSGPAVER